MLRFTQFPRYTYKEHYGGQDVPSYFPRTVASNYVDGFVAKFGVEQFITHSTEVTKLWFDEEREQFGVRKAQVDRVTGATGPEAAGTEYYNYVALATGPFVEPRVVTTKGFTGEQLHAKDWRGPDYHHGKTVIVVGAADSATDITLLLLKHGAKRVYVWVCRGGGTALGRPLRIPADPWAHGQPSTAMARGATHCCACAARAVRRHMRGAAQPRRAGSARLWRRNAANHPWLRTHAARHTGRYMSVRKLDAKVGDVAGSGVMTDDGTFVDFKALPSNWSATDHTCFASLQGPGDANPRCLSFRGVVLRDAIVGAQGRTVHFKHGGVAADVDAIIYAVGYDTPRSFQKFLAHDLQLPPGTTDLYVATPDPLYRAPPTTTTTTHPPPAPWFMGLPQLVDAPCASAVCKPLLNLCPHSLPT